MLVELLTGPEVNDLVLGLRKDGLTWLEVIDELNNNHFRNIQNLDQLTHSNLTTSFKRAKGKRGYPAKLICIKPNKNKLRKYYQ